METEEFGLPVDADPLKDEPPLPPLPPIDWAMIPGDWSDRVLTRAVAVTVTVLAMLPAPPTPPTLVAMATTVVADAAALAPPLPPLPPIDCARMPGDSVPLVSRIWPVLTCTVPDFPPLPPAPPRLTLGAARPPIAPARLDPPMPPLPPMDCAMSAADCVPSVDTVCPTPVKLRATLLAVPPAPPPPPMAALMLAPKAAPPAIAKPPVPPLPPRLCPTMPEDISPETLTLPELLIVTVDALPPAPAPPPIAADRVA